MARLDHRAARRRILRQLQAARARNNALWMGLVDVVFEVAPDRAKRLFRQINRGDAAIRRLVSRLTED